MKTRVVRYSFPLRFLSASSSDFLFSMVFPHLFFPVRTKMLFYGYNNFNRDHVLRPVNFGATFWDFFALFSRSA